MANTSRKGFWPIGTLSGAPWSGAVHKMKVDDAAADVFLGDLVRLEADGNVAPITAATDAILGSVVGVLPVTAQNPTEALNLSGNTEVKLAQKYSSAAGEVLVCVAPDAIYATESTSAVDSTGVGASCNVAISTGDTTTGLSRQVAGTATLGTSATSQLKIIGIAPSAGNDTSSANTKLHVTINTSFLAHNTAGV